MTRFLSVVPRVPVRELKRTVAFYVDTLGFRVAALWPREDPTFALLHRDAASLQFSVAGREPMEPVGHAGLYVEVTDALEIHRAVQERVAVEWGPEVYRYGRREFGFRDPDGYLVIISERTDAPPTCAEA